jgi:DNA helicase-2/ATP-dependent DNA helicase PcrA
LACSGDLDESLIQAGRAAIASQEKMLETISAAPVFQVGERVVHGVMGAGKIVSVDRDQSAYVIRFDSVDTPRTINFRAKLELAR